LPYNESEPTHGREQSDGAAEAQSSSGHRSTSGTRRSPVPKSVNSIGFEDGRLSLGVENPEFEDGGFMDLGMINQCMDFKYVVYFKYKGGFYKMYFEIIK
jgi:hypothetical protein